MSSATLISIALGIACLVLFFLWQGQVVQRRQLLAWLRYPEQEIPDGKGAWREVFSVQQQLRKAELLKRAALESQLGRFRLSAEALPDGVILLDDGAHIEWMNTAAAEHFDLSREHDVGTRVSQLIRGSGFHEFIDRFHTGESQPPLILNHSSRAQQRTYSLQLVAFAETGILLLSRDITDIAKTETMRRDFIANVSHELRTPITVIAGFLEQLTGEDRPPEPVAQRFTVLMAEQAQRMSRLVEDLLTLSRLEAGSEPLREEIIDVPALIHALRDEGQALSAGRHTLEITETCATRVRGNPDELRSAFGNLVSNAVRYTPEGGTIALRWRVSLDAPSFSVVDSGIGIAPEHITRLTERFYRVDKGRSTATGGTGLGLAIVKHVAARHQATLDIRSQIGQGSTFMLTFPASRSVKVVN